MNISAAQPLTRSARLPYEWIMDDWFGVQGGLVTVGLLATVPGCKDPDPDTDTTTGNTASTEPASTGDTPTGSGSATGTTGDTPTGSGSATGTTGDVDVPAACVSYGAKFDECNLGPIEGVDADQHCALLLMELEVYGADCVKAFEAHLACFSGLSCTELMSDPPKCGAEMQAVETECVPAVPPVCDSYGAKFAECLMEPTAAMAYAQMCGSTLMYYAKYYGADCVQASEAWFACLSALSCEEFLGHTMGDLPVCEVEDMARQTACN